MQMIQCKIHATPLSKQCPYVYHADDTLQNSRFSLSKTVSDDTLQNSRYSMSKTVSLCLACRSYIAEFTLLHFKTRIPVVNKQMIHCRIHATPLPKPWYIAKFTLIHLQYCVPVFNMQMIYFSIRANSLPYCTGKGGMVMQSPLMICY
jgi:hypothetical protein